MDKATQKSIEWQKANNTMAIGGDAFADMVDSFNVNPAFVAGYKEAEKDLALTPGDMSIIDKICTEMRPHTDWPLKGQDAFYEEVLRRFLKRKGEA